MGNETGADNIHIKSENEVINIIKESYNQRQVHDWNPKSYFLRSIQSIIDLAIRKGSKENSVVFYDDPGVYLILDESIEDRPLDQCKYSFEQSEELKSWMNVIDKIVTQKYLIDFLRQRDPAEVDNCDNLVASIKQLNIATQIIGEYSYDNNNNLSVFYKTKDAEGVAKIPSKIIIHVPFFNETDFICTLELDVILNKPRSEEEKPGFIITCPKFHLIKREALDYEVSKIKAGLAGWLILAGRP